jgi:hypothetical protein
VSVDDKQGWVPSSYLERKDGLRENTAIRTNLGEGNKIELLGQILVFSLFITLVLSNLSMYHVATSIKQKLQKSIMEAT